MTKKNNRLTKTILEMASDMAELGLIDKKTHKKITLRHMKKDKNNAPKIKPIKPNEIRHLREEAHLSQAAFACYLNLTVGYVSKLERGTTHPTGTTLALLNAIRRKGFRAVLQ